MLRKPRWSSVCVAVALVLSAPTNYSLMAVTIGVDQSISTTLLPKNPLSAPGLRHPGWFEGYEIQRMDQRQRR
jgi:hypothetical protein